MYFKVYQIFYYNTIKSIAEDLEAGRDVGVGIWISEEGERQILP